MRRRALVALAGIMLAGCSAAPPEQPVEIAFALKAGDQAAACAIALDGIGGQRAQLSDARLYVHDIRLIDGAGHAVPVRLSETPWQHDGVALLDFEDATGACRGTPATNTALQGTAPAGGWTGLSFVIGVPAALNHTSTTTAPPPLDSVAMGWSWQAGRKFIKVELDPEGGVVRAAGRPGITWHLHLGSTGCVGDPVKGETVSCGRPNRVPVTLAAFDPARQRVVLDLKSLFADSDIGRDGGGALGCMSGADDPDCPGVFARLGLDPVMAQPPFVRIEARP